MKKTLYFSSILFAAILSSCTTAYIPTEVNTPAFHESNEICGGLSYGSSGTNLQLGYSFYKNLGVIADIAYLRTTGSDPAFQRNWGFGLGYFNRLHKVKPVYYEVFGGFSVGETRTSFKEQEFTSGSGFENSRYYKIYIQPDMSFLLGFIDLIYSIRFNYFSFTSYEHHIEPAPVLPTALGVEPAFTIRMGSENVKFKCQVGFSYIGRLSGSTFNYDKVFMHFGIAFGF